jgi:hypothetical protein
VNLVALAPIQIVKPCSYVPRSNYRISLGNTKLDQTFRSFDQAMFARVSVRELLRVRFIAARYAPYPTIRLQLIGCKAEWSGEV